MKCANCRDRACYTGKDCTDIAEHIMEVYSDEDIRSLRVSARIESRYYMKKTRIEELIAYAKGMNYTRLGVAFCIGLQEEAETLCGVLSRHFSVFSVCCKVCGIDKSRFDLERLRDNEEVEAMCNPIAQAELLNRDRTDLNIILGLCIGHDIIFTKYSNAPVTTFAVKDRVLAHNPLGALYSAYHLRRLQHL